MDRAGKYMLGEKDHTGEPVTMSTGQLKALQLLKDTCLPAMQSVAWSDETEQPDMQTLEQQYAQAMQSLQPQDLKMLLQTMTKEERQGLIDSLDSTSQ